jgi:Tfp pilus assembly protein PilZ
VSQGGFFLATEDTFELFSDVELEVVLPNGAATTLPARIVHILTPDKAQGFGVPAGIGVQFEGLSEQQREEVQKLVAWARANDPRPRIPRRKPAADLTVLQSEPMLAYLFEHVDGQRDPEALAEELGIEAASIERMLRELMRLDVIELISAAPLASASPVAARPPQPRAATPHPEPKRSTLPPQQKHELSLLEKRITRDNLYSTLDVPENAKPEAIRERFQTLSAALRGFRPSASDAARIERAQNQLREAFGVLSSPHKRSEYDEYLARARELTEAEAQRGKRTPPAHGPVPPRAAAQAKRAQATRAEPPPTAAVTRTLAAQRPRGAQAAKAPEQPIGAAAQILGQAELALAGGKFT